MLATGLADVGVSSWAPSCSSTAGGLAQQRTLYTQPGWTKGATQEVGEGPLIIFSLFLGKAAFTVQGPCSWKSPRQA